MGLDMNLYREVRTELDFKEGKIKDLLDNDDTQMKAVSEVAYWRKFNALHRYMNEHFNDHEDDDNCVNMYLEIKDIEDLLSLLEKLKEKVRLGEGLIDDGWSLDRKPLDEIVETERGEIKAGDLEDGDIIITRHKSMSGESKRRHWVENIEKGDEYVDYKLVNKIEGKVITNPEICEMLLPTEHGFFFGDTTYDQWYMEQVEDTIPVLKKIINEHKELVKAGVREYDITYYYRAWY